MKFISLCRLLTVTFLLTGPSVASAEQSLRIAAASDLRFALDDIVQAYREANPEASVDVIYGSSGKMTTQIANGASYDVFFSADIRYPQKLAREGLTATEPTVYANGRIVLWSDTLDAGSLTLADLASEQVSRIAIAQPAHAPYGMRAREALKSAGVWEAIQHKLVFGENIAHAAQMTRSGAADAGIIALSLARFPELAEHNHHLIDHRLHQPLTQGFVVTKRARDKASAQAFVSFMATTQALNIMTRYGFVLPNETRSEGKEASWAHLDPKNGKPST